MKESQSIDIELHIKPLPGAYCHFATLGQLSKRIVLIYGSEPSHLIR
jgi:hypothetical protein